ncbi:PAS domain-containing sensor histidine kinase [bacterium]|nr:PAS domain-containing sensor histidine kinase [bacterium]
MNPPGIPDEQAAITLSERHYRHIMQKSADILHIHDRAGRIIETNEQTCISLGYSRDEMLSLNVSDFEESLTQEKLEQIWQQIRYGSTCTLEGLHRRKDGSCYPVEVRLGVFEAEERELIIASARDLTMCKEAAAEIVRRNLELVKARELARLKDHFLSTLSHEMKTPLSLILGYTELLQDMYPDQELLNGIEDGSRRLSEHINHMLDYSALLSDSLPLHPTEVALDEVIDQAIALSRETFQSNVLNVVTESVPDLPLVQGDFRRLLQMVLELLENARKFSPPGGKITVRTRACKSHVRLEVEDCGEGIPPAFQAHVWEAFRQFKQGDSQRAGGLGLGLTLVKKLAELHGGRVEMASMPGRGSLFAIFLPTCQ